MNPSFKIGDLAGKVGIPVETIRYYEREGLLPAPPRTAGNYRLYDRNALERLTFIRNCRMLDMTLEEVRSFLDAKDSPDQQCDGINTRVDLHIEQIDLRIAELARLKASLQSLRSCCDSIRPARDCGILHELTHDHDPHAPC